MAASTSPSSSSSRHVDTIIIGAGISGLACASKLLQHPYYKENPSKRLLVLEARDRIGGRINSVNVHGHRLDVGANWIHGVGTDERPNPLIKILPHKKVKQVDGMVVFQGTSAGSDGTGNLVVPKNVAGPLMASLWGIMGSLYGLAETTPGDESKKTSALQALTKTVEFENVFQTLPEEYHSTFSALPQFLEDMEAAPLVASSAEHPRDSPGGMPLLEFAGDAFEGDQVFLQDGFVPVLEEVGRSAIDAGIVNLGADVKQIDWSGITVHVTTAKGLFTADRVVCTLPLGVLQHDAESAKSIFEPKLPTEKEEAVQSLGFGTLDKIILVYDQPWWKEEPYSSILRKGHVKRPYTENNNIEIGSSPDSFLGCTAELPGLEIQCNGTTTPGYRILSVMNLNNLTGAPALSVFVSCANAVHVESLTNDQAGEIVSRTLRLWLGKEIPKPADMYVSRWAQDEFARGSYSHMITGLSELGHRECFEKPLVGEKGAALRFAGEHTNRDHFGTVHGALLSGWREAEGILKDLDG